MYSPPTGCSLLYHFNPNQAASALFGSRGSYRNRNLNLVFSSSIKFLIVPKRESFFKQKNCCEIYASNAHLLLLSSHTRALPALLALLLCLLGLSIDLNYDSQIPMYLEIDLLAWRWHVKIISGPVFGLQLLYLYRNTEVFLSTIARCSIVYMQS